MKNLLHLHFSMNSSISLENDITLPFSSWLFLKCKYPIILTNIFKAIFQCTLLIRQTYEGNSFLYYQYPKLKPEFLQLKLLSVIALLAIDAGSAIPSRIQPSGRQRRVVLRRRSRNRYCPLLCTATRVSSSSWSYWGGPGECQPLPLPGVKKNMSKRVHGQQRERERVVRERGR